MPQVSPKLEQWLEDLHKKSAVLLANGYKATAIGAREALANLARAYVKDSPAIEWVNEDLVFSSQYNVPVRIYHPVPNEERAVLLLFHGGGHSAGSVSVYDPICRKLAKATGQIVVSAEYRLAPENPYPAALTDAYAVARGIWDTLDERSLPYKKLLSIAGDSAGGAITSSVSQLAQSDENLKIAKQVLIYPSLDYTMSLPSIEENGENFFLTKERIAWYFDNYFQHTQDRRMASPLHGKFGPGLPRTLIISAGCDPLKDEALAYVVKLETANVPHEHIQYDDMVHAFLFLEEMVKEECDSLYQHIARFLNE